MGECACDGEWVQKHLAKRDEVKLTHILWEGEWYPGTVIDITETGYTIKIGNEEYKVPFTRDGYTLLHKSLAVKSRVDRISSIASSSSYGDSPSIDLRSIVPYEA